MAVPPELMQGWVVSVDTETATLGDHVVEIGLSVFRNGEPVNEWGSFIRPIVPIEPEATNVHGIHDHDVANAPAFGEVSRFIYDTLSMADVIVAYNYEYDRTVIGKEFDRVGMQWPERPCIDPYIFFKKFFKFNKGKKLTNAAERFGFRYLGAHRAVSDATMAGRILFKMAAVKPEFPKNMKELQQKQRTWIEEQFQEYYNYCVRSGKKLPTSPNFALYEPR